MWRKRIFSGTMLIGLLVSPAAADDATVRDEIFQVILNELKISDLLISRYRNFESNGRSGYFFDIGKLREDIKEDGGKGNKIGTELSNLTSNIYSYIENLPTDNNSKDTNLKFCNGIYSKMFYTDLKAKNLNYLAVTYFLDAKEICLKNKESVDDTIDGGQVTKKPTASSRRLRIRQDAKDLVVPFFVKDKELTAFNGSSAAIVSVNQDFKSKSTSVDVDAAVGYQILEPNPLLSKDGWESSLLVYADVRRKVTDNDKDEKNTLEYGLQLNFLGPDFHLTGSLSDLRDFENKTGAMVGEVDYQLPLGRLTDDDHISDIFYWNMDANLPVSYGAYYDRKAKIPDENKKDFLRGGLDVKLNMWSKDEEGRVSGNMGYKILHVFKGQYDWIRKFEAGIAFNVGRYKIREFEISFNYANGRDEDTLEKEEALTVNFGFRY